MNAFQHYGRMLRMWSHYRQGTARLPYPPIRLWTEATSACNLRCVMCPQSGGEPFDRGFMEWDLFQKIMDEAAGFAFDTNLHHRGESLLHKEIGRMAAHASEKGLFTRLHTNGTLLDEDRARALVRSGLKLLSFSFDGFEKETYEKIRQGADFEETLGNILRFLRIKKETGSATPYTIFEVIDFSEYLPEEMHRRRRAFRKRFDGLPLDKLVVKLPHNWAGTYFEAEKIGREHGDYSPCTFPWYAAVVFWDGTVVPCPQDFFGKLKMGNLREKPLREIWNGEPYRELRHKMVSGAASHLNPCAGCDMLSRKTFLGVPTANLKNFVKENLFGNP